MFAFGSHSLENLELTEEGTQKGTWPLSRLQLVQQKTCLGGSSVESAATLQLCEVDASVQVKTKCMVLAMLHLKSVSPAELI